MVDLSLGFDIAAIFGTLVYMSLLIAESFGAPGKWGSEDRSFEGFQYRKRSLLNQHVSIR